MQYYDFIYDGEYLSEYGYMICDFNGNSGFNIISNGSNIIFNTVSSQYGRNNYKTNTKYEDTLSSVIQICKSGCEHSEDVSEITPSEIRFIMKWLNRHDYLKLKFISKEYGEDDYYYEASFNVNRIEHSGKIIGLELNIQTNRPFALSENYPYEFNLNSKNTFDIVDESDEEGFIYPKMKITILEDGNLNIKNSIDNRIMTINNCAENEIIYINYPVIYSSLESHKIQDDFNWSFLRISNNNKENNNTLSSTLNCDIVLSYNPIVKVGV